MTNAPTAYNPYRHLAAALRAQLKLEEQMTAEDRERISWMVRVEFCGESMTLGKGHVNTIFYFRNEGKRKMCYPNEALALLSKLGRQEHVMYRVLSVTGEGERAATLISALARPPEKGATIVGLTVDGKKEVLRLARRNVAGKLAWIAAK